MPVPIPGSKVGSDSQKVKFLTIFGRPKTRIFREFRGVPGQAPLVPTTQEESPEPSADVAAPAAPKGKKRLAAR